LTSHVGRLAEPAGTKEVREVDVFVLGRKQVVPDEVRTLAEQKVGKLARLAPVLDHAEVRITEDKDTSGGGARQVCEVTMTGHGHTLRARASAPDAPVAVDRVVEKLEHQVERLKGKLVGRSHPRHARPAAEE
jgi:ribosomal subunit interface protein